MTKLRSLGALLALLAIASPANSAELKIFGSRVTKVIVGELGARFEKSTGYQPLVVADVAAVMKRRIEAGRLSTEMAEELLRKHIRAADHEAMVKDYIEKLGSKN